MTERQYWHRWTAVGYTIYERDPQLNMGVSIGNVYTRKVALVLVKLLNERHEKQLLSRHSRNRRSGGSAATGNGGRPALTSSPPNNI